MSRSWVVYLRILILCPETLSDRDRRKTEDPRGPNCDYGEHQSLNVPSTVGKKTVRRWRFFRAKALRSKKSIIVVKKKTKKNKSDGLAGKHGIGQHEATCFLDFVGLVSSFFGHPQSNLRKEILSWTPVRQWTYRAEKI